MSITTLLTDTEIRKAKPSDKVITLSDGAGLEFPIKLNGSKILISPLIKNLL